MRRVVLFSLLGNYFSVWPDTGKFSVQARHRILALLLRISIIQFRTSMFWRRVSAVFVKLFSSEV